MGDEGFADNLKSTMANLQTSSDQFAAFTTKMNSGKGALSKMVDDPSFANRLDSTLKNLQSGTKGLSENMEAAKHNILLRGYFKKKKKLEDKRIQQIQDSLKLRQDMKQDTVKDSATIHH
jgi:phospholipid/cholesterol/gamma-HCH transport system substrate-binding protein